MERVLSLLRVSLLGLTVIVAVLLLCACLAPFISPETTWLFVFPGLMFPGLVVANVLLAAFWLIFKRSYMLIPVMALLLSAWNISNQIGWKTCRSVQAPENSFSVLSFNVKVFDLYSWTQNAQSKDHILDIIKNLNADVLCLQEFYTDSAKFNTLRVLKAQYPYHYFHQTLTLDTFHHWGIATFSKFPIVGHEVMPFTNSMHNVCISTDMVINGDTVRVFNAHLQSIYFNKQDIAGMKNLMEREVERKPLERSFQKLKIAFEKRAEQADMIHEKIKASPHKVLVCGDMNDTPNSYTYRTISQGLEDSFLEGGCGFGLTYTAPYPFLRIDYILAGEGISTLAHKTQWNYSSDHFAVYAIFENP